MNRRGWKYRLVGSRNYAPLAEDWLQITVVWRRVQGQVDAPDAPVHAKPRTNAEQQCTVRGAGSLDLEP